MTSDAQHPAIELASEVSTFYVRNRKTFMNADITPPDIYLPQPPQVTFGSLADCAMTVEVAST